jgi:hypothetical protein
MMAELGNIMTSGLMNNGILGARKDAHPYSLAL